MTDKTQESKSPIFTGLKIPRDYIAEGVVVALHIQTVFCY